MILGVEQIPKLWCLLCCHGLLFRRRSHTCCLWKMWFTLTQSRSSLCRLVTSSEEMKSLRPTLQGDASSAPRFAPVTSHLKKVVKMDTNSNRWHQVQLNLRFIYQVCLFKQAWPLVHTYPLCLWKRAVRSGEVSCREAHAEGTIYRGGCLSSCLQ